jgi:hypothetical protein
MHNVIDSIGNTKRQFVDADLHGIGHGEARTIETESAAPVRHCQGRAGESSARDLISGV